MTTETTTAQETTEAATDAGTTAATETTTTATTTVLGTDGDGSSTAGDVEAGKGAETGADDGKATDATKAGDKPGDGKTGDKSAEGPPEKYEFTMPEGVQLDEALVGAIEPALRDAGLTQEQASKLTTAFAEYRVSEAQRQSEAFAQQVEGWGNQARDDKEYGGAKFEESARLAQSAIAKFGTPELKALMQDGWGNHPELIRLCVRVGKAMGEDGGINAGSRTPAAKDPASVLFDHPTSQPKR
jgi:hypothetical protein